MKCDNLLNGNTKHYRYERRQKTTTIIFVFFKKIQIEWKWFHICHHHYDDGINNPIGQFILEKIWKRAYGLFFYPGILFTQYFYCHHHWIFWVENWHPCKQNNNKNLTFFGLHFSFYLWNFFLFKYQSIIIINIWKWLKIGFFWVI